MTPECEEDYRATHLPIWRPTAHDLVARAQFNHSTLIGTTAAQFGEHWARNMFARPAVLWLTKASSLPDCVAFWNYRAMQPLRYERAECVLLPIADMIHWLGLDNHVASMATRPGDVSPDVLITSMSVTRDGLNVAARALGLVAPEDQRIRSGTSWPPPPIREKPFTYLIIDAASGFRFLTHYQRSYGTVTQGVAQAFRGDTELRFSNPVDFSTPPAVLLRFGGSLFAPFPRRQSVATLIHANANWADDRLEFRTHTYKEVTFTVSLPAAADVVGAVLNETGLSWRLSDKGKIGSALMTHPALESFIDPQVHLVMRTLMTPRSRDMLKALKMSGAASTQALADVAARFGGRVERRYRSAEQVNVALPVRILEELADAELVERGFEVSCNVCGMGSFVPLEHAAPSARCPGCRHAQRFSRSDRSVTLFYRLDSLVDRAADQGVLPHLQAIAALGRIDSESYLLPGVEVTTGPAAEADLIGVYEGEILVGEAKTSKDRWTHEQINRDVQLASRLRADSYLIAASGGISAGAIEHALGAVRKAGLGLVCVNVAEVSRLQPSCKRP